MKAKINQKFNILSALGIVLVVGGHCGFEFIDWFPIYSFHMALFMFISGYFFTQQGFGNFFIKKFKRLVIPLLSWNAFYGVVMTVLVAYGFTELYHQDLTLRSLFWDPFTMGWQFWFNGPSWFAGTLFLVQLVYWFLYWISGKRMALIGAFTLFLHIVAIWLALHHYADYCYEGYFSNAGLGASRVLYCVFFYWLGHLYRLKLESRDSFSVDKIVCLFICNALILGFATPHVGVVVNTMAFPTHKYWVPVVVSCTGIWLYLQFAEVLKTHVSDNELISYIGRHSWDIMVHQFFFFWILNTLLLWLKNYGILNLNTFDYAQYMHDIYFRISAHPPVNRLIYLIAGVMGPVVCCWLYEKYAKAHVLRFRRNLLLHIDKIRSGGVD